jgi:SAM-dependent methyltransferase
MTSSTYLLPGQVSELERLKLQSRVWEPGGRRLLEEIGDGRGSRPVDIGCGVMGWLRLLSEWVGPDGEVVGTDIDDAMLAEAKQFVADEDSATWRSGGGEQEPEGGAEGHMGDDRDDGGLAPVVEGKESGWFERGAHSRPGAVGCETGVNAGK